jgi:hypothetical protein
MVGRLLDKISASHKQMVINFEKQHLVYSSKHTSFLADIMDEEARRKMNKNSRIKMVATRA